MRVLGIDFTSAPSTSRPLFCALGRVEGTRLILDALFAFESLECFGNLLGCRGPWLAAMNFPLGLPRGFVQPLDWPVDWQGYVDVVAGMAHTEFGELARAEAARRAHGSRDGWRKVDRIAVAHGAVNASRCAVGLKFHAGAPSLLASGATVVPLHRGDPDRTVVEAYPGLVAQALIGPRPYKGEARASADDPRTRARARLLAALAGDALKNAYGLTLQGIEVFGEDLRQDARADGLDAILCAVQAAWAWQHRDAGFGIPEYADPCEGWIADPATRVEAART